MVLLFRNSGSRNKTMHSEYRNLEILGSFLTKFEVLRSLTYSLQYVESICPTCASNYYFPHIKYGKYWFHLQKKILLLLIFTFYDFLYLKYEFRAKKKFRLSRGVVEVAVRSLVEICIIDISADLRAKNLRFRLTCVSWAELMLN
jgi:hypothetical protein